MKGEFFFGVWNVVSRGIGFFNTLIVLSQLTIYQYGVFQLILTSFSGLAVFMGFGGETIRNDILRYVGVRNYEYAKKLFWESSVFRLVIAVILWAGVFFGAPLFFTQYSPEFIVYIKIISFLFLHDAILPSFRLILESEKKFNLIASRASLGRFIQLGIVAYFYFFAVVGLKEVILSIVISSFVSLAIVAVSVITLYVKSWKPVRSVQHALIYSVLFSYGKWELLRPVAGKVVDFVQVWVTKIFIGTEAVAIFSVAQTMLGTLANLFPVNTLSALVPLHVADKEKLQKIYNVGSKYLVIFSIAIGLVGLVLAPPFIYLFFPKYAASLPYFSVLLVTLPISALSIVASIFLTVYRKQGFLLVQKLLKGLIGAILYVVFIPWFGMWGLVLQVIVLSIILYAILHTYLLRARLDVALDWKYMVRFDDSDREFLRNVYADIKKVVKRRMPSRIS